MWWMRAWRAYKRTSKREWATHFQQPRVKICTFFEQKSQNEWEKSKLSYPSNRREGRRTNRKRIINVQALHTEWWWWWKKEHTQPPNKFTILRKERKRRVCVKTCTKFRPLNFFFMHAIHYFIIMRNVYVYIGVVAVVIKYVSVCCVWFLFSSLLHHFFLSM